MKNGHRVSQVVSKLYLMSRHMQQWLMVLGDGEHHDG
jgi:hypothetical protein